MAVVAASNSRKGSFLAGAAMAIGLVPSRGSAPSGGTASEPAAVYVTPTMSSLAAIIAWWPMAPEWPELKTETTPTPTWRALSMAMRISRGPRMVTSPLSQSTVAVPGASRIVRTLGRGLSVPLVYCSM